jgi:hypothetical protein
MTKFYRWVLNHICRKLVLQGPTHKANITEYYAIMERAAQDEFREDNRASLCGFLDECHTEAHKDEQQRIGYYAPDGCLGVDDGVILERK